MTELEVIGAGWGRTGTMSTKAALEVLGYKSYHMIEVVQRNFAGEVEVAPSWERALNAKRAGKAVGPEVWREIFKGYTATVDHPGCLVYRELMQVYPDAKVILTVREPKTWVKSVKETVFNSDYSRFQRFCENVEKFFLPPVRRFRRMVAVMHHITLEDRDPRLLSGTLGDEHDEIMAKNFEEWNEEVKRTVPADRLLIFNVKEGWAPLCKFLGKPIPDVPFPNVNETNSFKKYLLRTKIVAMSLLALPVAVSIGAYYILNRTS